MSEIKRCPFCNAEMEEHKFTWKHPKTPNCILSGYMIAKNTKDVELWNTRKPVEEVVKRLERRIGRGRDKKWDGAMQTALEIIKEEVG